MATGRELLQLISQKHSPEAFRQEHWVGTFSDYLDISCQHPGVNRTAYQRLYDMVISYGEEEYIDNKKRLIRYPFFRDPIDNGKDAIHGLDIPLMRLVHVLQAASQGYGPEKRIILLHGPVGSSKSTIARLLKKGIEAYTRTTEGCLYTFRWVNLQGTGCVGKDDETGEFPCPMHEEPLCLIPEEWRERALQDLALGNDRHRVRVVGDLDPACRFIFKRLLAKYDGDWGKVHRW